MKLRTLSILRLATVLAAVACTSHVLDAQVLYGSLTGNVTDPSGPPFPAPRLKR